MLRVELAEPDQVRRGSREAKAPGRRFGDRPADVDHELFAETDRARVLA